MTEPLAIPKRKDKARAMNNHRAQPPSPSDMTMAPLSPTATDYYDTRFSPASIDSCIGYTPSPTSSQSRYQSLISAKDKGKGPAKSISMSRSSSEGIPSSWVMSERRTSLLGMYRLIILLWNETNMCSQEPALQRQSIQW